MKRKPVIYGMAAAAALVVLGFIGWLTLHYEPQFYRSAQPLPGPDRKRCSVEFVRAAVQLGIDSREKSQWRGQFTAEQVNSYLCENFVSDGTMEQLLPEGITDPRVAFGDGKVHLAFRYGKPPWNTIISVDLRIWRVPKECNVIALEIEGIHAGLLPVSVQSMLERLVETIRQHHRSMEFTWYRYKGHRVALLRLQADKTVPTISLEQIDIHDGDLTIYGCAQ